MDIDPAIPLGDDESIEWGGRPRLTVVIPAVVFGLALVIAGVLGVMGADLPVRIGLVVGGITIPLGRYFINQNIQYVITDRALYVKRGVLTRSVMQANLETVQNSSYSQDITGSLFGYGSVEFEIAGSADLEFRAIDRPEEVRTLVDHTTGSGDGIAGERISTSDIPGHLDQWREIRDEVQAVHRALEGRR